MLNLNKCTKTKPKPTLVFQNCSYVCVCIIVHNCRTRRSTEQFWWSSLLSSRQSSQLRSCLLEGKEKFFSRVMASVRRAEEPLPRGSSSELRNDATSVWFSLVEVSAWSFIQCFFTVGWVLHMAASLEKPLPLSSTSSLLFQNFKVLKF